jgi:hypothetical protein
MTELIVDILNPNSQYGDTNTVEDFLTIGTNRRAKTPEQFDYWNYFDISPDLPDASSGSFVSWTVPNGDYLVKGQLFSKERSLSGDSFGYFDGENYTELYTADDLIELPGIGQILDVEFEVSVTSGELNLSVWDTEDNRGTSMLRIDSITGIEETHHDDLIYPWELRIDGQNEFELRGLVPGGTLELFFETSEDIFMWDESATVEPTFFHGLWENPLGDSFFVESEFIPDQGYDW